MVPDDFFRNAVTEPETMLDHKRMHCKELGLARLPCRSKIWLTLFESRKKAIEIDSRHVNYDRAIQDFVTDWVRGLIDIDGAGDKEIVRQRQCRADTGSVASFEWNTVRMEIQDLAGFNGRQNIRQVVLDSGEIHFIENHKYRRVWVGRG